MSSGPHGVALECVGEVFEHGRKLFVRSGGAERLHAIDRFDPPFARELHRRRLRRLVARAAQTKRLVLARAVRQRVLRGCAATANPNNQRRSDRYMISSPAMLN